MSKKQKNKGTKNREIVWITYVFVAIFLIMIANLSWFMVVDSEEAINNSFNPRQEILAGRNRRGKIFSADGEVLAETVMGSNGKDKRVYPFDNLFSHIVGFSTNGKMGVELLANFQLLSSDVPIGQKVKNDLEDKKNPGNNAVTTLDTRLQEVAYKELGAYKGAIIVTEPKTGKILAMVSKPDFDPNEIDAIWNDLLEDTESSVLLNRATQGLYPPGSTFKILTALAYYRENPEAFKQYTYQCNGKFKLDGNTIRCYHGAKHGNVDITKSFAKSCNASFADIGSSLDREQFGETLEKVLFNRELPLKINYKKSSVTMNGNTDISDLLQASIGQGKTQITPMHLSMITSAIANQGVLMTPYLVERIESSSGSVLKNYGDKEYGALMTPEEAAILTELMSAVVEEGTGTKLSGLSYTAAGKTGSAEYSGVKTESHAWFTGFAPAKDPEVTVTIIIEGAGSGGDYAVPIAKRIFDAYFAISSN